ncbi:MAG: class II fructose-bisphosphatase [Actinomycetia bacterium]|nr:class II fructose-bisphosphatase [Actinomycetes bacterium]
MTPALGRSFALDLAKVTERAAVAAAHWQGRADKEAVDQAAVDGMREHLNTIPFDGVVVIGEGEKDHAPMLHNGERVGNGQGPRMDIAVDPVDGTSLTARGGPGALSVIAVAGRGTMFSPGGLVYMDKLAVGPEAAGVIDLEAPVSYNLEQVARAKGLDLDQLTVIVLDRPRNRDYIREIRRAGARIRMIGDGDVSAAIATARPETGIDLLMGIGGSPEAVIAAAAMRCMGGEIQTRLWAGTDQQRQYAIRHEQDLNQVMTTCDLVGGGEAYLAATGVTTGEFLRGVEFGHDQAITHSVTMRASTGTIRYIKGLIRKG